ncbi:MAG: AraC family transcriptional regulator [Gammaproteobacteria bacterium]
MPDRSINDLLSDFLVQSRVNASVFATPSVCGAWRINTTGMHRLGFHLVARGTCWLHMRGFAAPEALRAGDLLVVRGDHWHLLSPEVELDGEDMLLPEGGSGRRTDLICGSISFPDSMAEALLNSLPQLVLLRTGEGETDTRLETLARLMAIEARSADSGRQVVLDRLADILLVMVLRHVMARGLVRSGLLAALADPRLSRALAALHQEPGAAWTLAGLAECAGMARTAFAQRFAAIMGDTPMNYLATWRMQQADRLLRDRRLSVAQVAEQLGYSTEAAFRRAFKRIRGVGPGEVRRIRGRGPPVNW